MEMHQSSVTCDVNCTKWNEVNGNESISHNWFLAFGACTLAGTIREFKEGEKTCVCQNHIVQA